MPSKRRFSFLHLPLLIITFVLLSKSSPVEAVWTFDGYNPTASMVEKSKNSDKITLLMTILDNYLFTLNNKKYYFVVTASTTTPTSIPPSDCRKLKLIRDVDLPCRYEIVWSGFGSIIQGPIPNQTKSAQIEAELGPFSGNIVHYIYGRVNQDDAGNTGRWSNGISFTPSVPAKIPFIQTQEGDVHTNEGITNPGGR